MQDFRDLGKKIDEKIDVSEMIAKLNMDQRRVFDKIIDTAQRKRFLYILYSYLYD